MLSPDQNWQQLTSGTVKPVSGSATTAATHVSDLATYAKKTLATSLDVLRDLDEEEDSILEGTDLYELNTISNCLVSVLDIGFCGRRSTNNILGDRNYPPSLAWAMRTTPNISRL